MSGQEFDLPNLLVFLKEVTETAPAYHFEFLGLTTRINSTLDRAEVSVRAKLLGDRPGVVKKGMFVVEYHLLEGEWKCVKQTSFAAGELLGWE
ncbi:hypothetical protein Slin15195_G043530 [Septoria linicola]|uniref:SnoaL-like domain-containing protein n=1 Tax=Septoria linicola TaxID=215465 RepID=A0A9Q9AKK5_9PEZI|nr:hypothetical protein Slin14017_G047050 [Septoria linicola]USW51034.1 hypothetical protein Slin15195_G043530 [Septoria linicola]